jgi:predicted ATPase
MAGEIIWRVSTLRLPGRTNLSPEELRTYQAVQLFVERARALLPTST